MPNGEDIKVFERDIVNGKLYSELIIDSKELGNKYDVYLDEFKQNEELLFLFEMNRAKTEIYKENSPLNIYKKVFGWFLEVLDVNFPESAISSYSYFKDIDNKDEICRIIKCLGTGITNFTERIIPIEGLKDEFPLSILKKIEDSISESEKKGNNNGHISPISMRINDKYFLITPNKSGKVEVTTIAFNHGNEELFNFEEESDGTRRILELIKILLNKEEKVYIVDEIDRSLHPQLTYKFINEFLNIVTRRNTQLIITTHESRLLDFGLLRQDEIWIANKNKPGDTGLYSLDEYNVRFDKKVDKAYLEGRYGGVPIFGTIFPLKEE